MRLCLPTSEHLDRWFQLRRRMRLQALRIFQAPWRQLARCVRHHRRIACGRVLRSWAAYCQLLDAFFARVC